jgi:transcriptional regulator with XRE-family HTH domain
MREITLTQWREEIGLSVERLAAELGVSTDELLLWERDEASCPYQKMLEHAMESIAIEADGSLDRAIAAADAALERSEAFDAKYAEDEKRRAAWWKEHNAWMKEHDMTPGREWRNTNE